ncbi:MAG: sulfatase-like hydrolase/transferase [Anaerolineales bacterium]|nr:sulfatase-like hydrolase/transferase [Anaerolineales bacterium]
MPGSNDRPNVIFLMTDALRATALGLYGNRDVRTPHLERMADEGCFFEWTYCPNPSCVPSRCAVLTGRYPHTCRSRVNFVLLQPEERTFPEDLRDAGYQVAHSGKNHAYPYSGRNSLNEVFDWVYEVSHTGPVAPNPDPEITAYKRFLRRVFHDDVIHLGEPWYPATTPFRKEICSTYLTVDGALSYLSSAREPFFLHCSIPEPHTPYTAPEPYASMYDPQAIELPDNFHDDLTKKPTYQQITQVVQRMDTEPEAHIREGLAMYYGMINFIDDQVGRLLDYLRTSGLAERTIVIFTTDHGEYVGEHGMISKANQLYDSLMRVPLIVWGPGHINGGQRVDHLMEQIDLAPTILELCGVPIPHGMQARSFASLLRGEEYQPREVVFAESGMEGEPTNMETALELMEKQETLGWGGRPYSWRGRVKMLRTRRWKYCYYLDGQQELYDMQEDPLEMTNLADRPEHQSMIHDFQRQLLNWCIATEDTVPVWPPVQPLRLH